MLRLVLLLIGMMCFGDVVMSTPPNVQIRFPVLSIQAVPEVQSGIYLSGVRMNLFYGTDPLFSLDDPYDFEYRDVLTDPHGESGITFKPLTEVHIVGPVLNYPNPFLSGKKTEIGFHLEMPGHVDLTLIVYNMLGHQVARKDVNTSNLVHYFNYFRIPFSSDDTYGELPAGPYFYLILYQNKIIGKNKMGVIPSPIRF